MSFLKGRPVMQGSREFGAPGNEDPRFILSFTVNGEDGSEHTFKFTPEQAWVMKKILEDFVDVSINNGYIPQRDADWGE